MYNQNCRICGYGLNAQSQTIIEYYHVVPVVEVLEVSGFFDDFNEVIVPDKIPSEKKCCHKFIHDAQSKESCRMCGYDGHTLDMCPNNKYVTTSAIFN
jgi:hypothetical protein